MKSTKQWGAIEGGQTDDW